jgi:glycerophosphoryl diester phosphodiesterase
VAALVKRYNLSERVFFSSFNPLALLRMKRLLPQTPIGLLAMAGGSGALARSWLGRLLGYQSLHPEAGDVTTRLVERTHRAGARVMVYTVNTAAEMRRLFDLGVDAIFTDDPVLARQTLSVPDRKTSSQDAA